MIYQMKKKIKGVHYEKKGFLLLVFKNIYHQCRQCFAKIPSSFFLQNVMQVKKKCIIPGFETRNCNYFYLIK